ncbi:MAG: D-alanyl-D-alanine carboxypeptidase [Gammaproteobacteria bacterium]|nr:D-alanyl-D-alanine carboxypeptidase [Gammaproteobacteria bacterium]
MPFFRVILPTLALLFISITTGTSVTAATPAPPKVAASSYILIDYTSGQILAENNSDQRLEPASITKIMTAYTVLKEIQEGNLNLKDKTVVSEKAWRMPGSRMFIEKGSKIDIETLLKGMIIQSGNDASVALAEHVAGSEEAFAGLMNKHAQDLGMTQTNFINSTGMPDSEHVTTARDITRMAKAIIKEFPKFYSMYSIKVFTHNNIKQYNRNKLLWRDKSVDGIKTGHTENAGYCLVASAKRNDMRLISVVMGTESTKARTKASQSLLNYGFRFYETHRLYGAGETLNSARIWHGDREQLALGLQQNLHITIPRNQYKNLKAEMVLNPNLEAPINKGARIGTVKITLAGKPFTTKPLVALHDVASGGLWRKAKDSVLRWFK